mmetsp:Transcript_33595/g.85453  ORF Transcript_33595/g.85453 Transcript_33595/m.85453 type:complete len:232 (-) Transcript_33595:29-724(-)
MWRSATNAYGQEETARERRAGFRTKSRTSKPLLPIRVARCLVVAAVHLTLRVENAPPVLGLELSLRVHVDLHLDRAALLAHREGRDVRGGRQATDKQPADRGRAPGADLLARLEAELRKRDGLNHSALLAELRERRGLAGRRHLVRQRVEAALRVAHNRNLLPIPEARVNRSGLRLRRGDPRDPDLLVGHHHLDARRLHHGRRHARGGRLRRDAIGDQTSGEGEEREHPGS